MSASGGEDTSSRALGGVYYPLIYSHGMVVPVSPIYESNNIGQEIGLVSFMAYQPL